MELRYFTAVAEHLNYSEASRRIHVAQPAISQTILDLEEELGVRLLLRDPPNGVPRPMIDIGIVIGYTRVLDG